MSMWSENACIKNLFSPNLGLCYIGPVLGPQRVEAHSIGIGDKKLSPIRHVLPMTFSVCPFLWPLHR